ncbi:Ketopantoate reductase ApbA/PanE [Venturia nashicola]|uniref:2-dehydropantoate 2-reductase n=1 Tax=Venturia nashicola TaxID=86259 RepID=A0A4Z1NMD0_9PEZI|nr:Ketopantoate reductase ApbA/PanE [Venturia nashicola]
MIIQEQKGAELTGFDHSSAKRCSSSFAELPSLVDEEGEDAQPVFPRRIHILGLGGIGSLVAHSLKSLPDPPPVTLIYHRERAYDDWQTSSQEIKVTTNGMTVARSGFDAELQRTGFRRHGKTISAEEFFYSNARSPDYKEFDAMERPDEPDDFALPERDITEPIDCLIVTVKAPKTAGALLAVRKRLGPRSTILFLQNGVGIIDDVDEQVFPDPASRPQYMVGIVTHAVNTPQQTQNKKAFGVIHAGKGSIFIGLPCARETSSSSSSSDPYALSPASDYLLRTVCRSPILSASPLSPIELLQAQLEKLATNAIINPLTVLIDARNGALLYNYALSRVARLLLAEISLVLRTLPELQNIPNVSTRFSTERLETKVVALSTATASNISSMLADVRHGRRTEIDYVTGYIVKRGEELGISCFMNYLIMQIVKGKQQVIDKERQDDLPFPDSEGSKPPRYPIGDERNKSQNS